MEEDLIDLSGEWSIMNPFDPYVVEDASLSQYDQNLPPSHHGNVNYLRGGVMYNLRVQFVFLLYHNQQKRSKGSMRTTARR